MWRCNSAELRHNHPISSASCVMKRKAYVVDAQEVERKVDEFIQTFVAMQSAPKVLIPFLEQRVFDGKRLSDAAVKHVQ